MKQTMLESVIILTLICLIAASLLGGAYLTTEERIAEQDELKLKNNLKEVFPSADDFEMKDDYYIAKQDNEIIGFVAITETQGYGSIITMVIGMGLNKTVTGLRILDHEETPGLGANIAKPEFYSQFTGLLSKDIKLKKDRGQIDAVTAATVSSTAVTSTVQNISVTKLEKLIDNIKTQNVTLYGRRS